MEIKREETTETDSKDTDPKGTHGELLARLDLAKTDRRALNGLIKDYLPFIKKCVAQISLAQDKRADLLTDAMLAFARSVETYKSEEGTFIQYAALVIRNRLIDSMRKELLLERRFFFSSPRRREEDSSWENNVSQESHRQQEEAEKLSLEIQEINREFALWGFTWDTLVKKCPKQERSRRMAWGIAETISRNPPVLEETLKTRRLPLSFLVPPFSRKVIEKYRTYIAALVILSRGEYPYIYSFVPQFFQEDEFV